MKGFMRYPSLDGATKDVDHPTKTSNRFTLRFSWALCILGIIKI